MEKQSQRPDLGGVVDPSCAPTHAFRGLLRFAHSCGLHAPSDRTESRYVADMREPLNEDLRVGGVTVPFAKARGWVTAYVDTASSRRSKKPYAYPAYDGFSANSGPDELSDGDLLTPGLLNVPINIRTFYELQRVRPQLVAALRSIPVDLSLERAEEQEVRRFTHAVYAALDEKPRPAGVQATTLSKVLHRKRPDFLILHDKQVRLCYVGSKRPVPRDSHRSWADYMTAVSLAVAEDLREQESTWSELAALTRPVQGPQISRLRLLDVVAWNAGR